MRRCAEVVVAPFFESHAPLRGRIGFCGRPSLRSGTHALHAILILALAAGGCRRPDPGPPPQPAGRPFVEAERIFHANAKWLGSDAALSIPLGKERTLWLFGDTFVATSDRHVREESKMVRNTVAVQQGLDPRSASIQFHWRRNADDSPASFFPENGARWYWPGHGTRLAKGPLIVFLYTIAATPGKGLGFASAGWAVAVINDNSGRADGWKTRIVEGPAAPFDAVPATAVVQDGAFVVALAIRQEGTHAGALVRWQAVDLARGRLDGAEWWAGADRGWVPQALVGAAGPAFVLDDAGAECSLHQDARTGTFVHVASYGFGASTIGLRTAPSVTGPWSAPATVYRPPESGGARRFVYAAKAHPELTGPTPAELLVTYATNSFDFGDLFTEAGSKSLYWPRFVAVLAEPGKTEINGR